MPIYDIKETTGISIPPQNYSIENTIEKSFNEVYDKIELTKNELACMVDREDDRIDKVFNRIASTKNDLKKLQKLLDQQIQNDRSRINSLENESLDCRLGLEDIEQRFSDKMDYIAHVFNGLIAWGGGLTIAMIILILKVCGVF